MPTENQTISYEDRVRSQIEQYKDTVDMHDLPEIFHIWSEAYIAPGLQHVFKSSSIDQIYADAYKQAKGSSAEEGRILSIGCGDGGVEIRVAKLLLEQGISKFKFFCADLSPILLASLKAGLEREGLAAQFEPIEADLNRIDIPGHFDMIMANHSLHHIEGLEHLFQYVRKSLTNNGIFATSDMIGRNGHMRWRETSLFMDAIWPLLDMKQRYHIQLQRYGDTFVDHDCSTEGFEGIRAQDILPIALEYLYPFKFMGTGGFIDLFVDRGYGHAYDIKNDDHVKFIKFIADVNEFMLDSGVVKPTIMIAYFTKDDRGEIFYRDRRATSSVRRRDGDPAWTRFFGK